MTAPAKWIYLLSCTALFAMPFGTSPFTIVGFCILGVWLFSGEFLRARRLYLRAPWFPPVLAVVSLAWLGLIWSCDPWGLGIKFALKTHYWLYALAVAGIAPLIRDKHHLIMAFLGGLLLNAVAGLLQLGSAAAGFPQWGAKGYSGFCSGYSTLGILLVLGILVASYYYREAVGRNQRILLGLLMLTYFGHLMIQQGRGGYLIFVLLSPVVFRNVLRGKKMVWIIVACLLATGVLFSSPVVRHRVDQAKADIQHHLQSNSGERWGKKYSEHQDRFYMWRWAIVLFLEHPVLGLGTGCYRQAVLSQGGEVAVDHPHSSLLYMAASFGLVGLFVFVWLFWTLLKTGWKNREKTLGFFVMASTVVLLVGGFTDSQILDSGGAFLLAVTTGLQSGTFERAGGGKGESS